MSVTEDPVPSVGPPVLEGSATESPAENPDAPLEEGGKGKAKMGQMPYPKFMPLKGGPFVSAQGRKSRLYDSEMTPEETLAEFISTSAAYHGVKRQDIKSLEWDLLLVFANNVMPANAAAWYMAKRRFYFSFHYTERLLPVLLKSYPKKFAVDVQGNEVEFLEKYSKDVAKHKLRYLVQYGLFAYFSHKADAYGVYFFDPLYYETKEPFRTNLMLATHANAKKKGLTSHYFKMLRSQFHYKQHSEYLVSISKEETQIEVNCYGVIRKMLNRTQGIIEFQSSSGVERALFSMKALFNNGFQVLDNPEGLPTIKFDGYKIPSGQETSGMEYSWYAVLVWVGKKPSPKFCAGKDLLRNPFAPQGKNASFKESENRGIFEPLPLPCSEEYILKGKVLAIQKNGALAEVEAKGEENDGEKVLIPGWSAKFENQREKFASLPNGNVLFVGDQVAFYVDRSQESDGVAGTAVNTIILVHAKSGKGDSMNAKGKSGANKGRKRQRRKGLSSSSESSTKGSKKRLNSSEILLKLLSKEDFEDGSDSEASYFPPPIYDTDYDYDEYTDCEIDAEEEAELLREASESLDSKSLFPEKVEGEEAAEAKKLTAWKEYLLHGEEEEDDPKDLDYKLPFKIEEDECFTNKNDEKSPQKDDGIDEGGNDSKESEDKEIGDDQGLEEAEISEEELTLLLKEVDEPIEIVVERMKMVLPEQKAEE